MGRVFIVIQARVHSSRLDSKILLPLCGKTVLEVMLDRLNDFKDDIIIATTDDGSEKPIVEIAQKCGVKHFCGSQDNVLKRYFDACKYFGAEDNDTIVRLTSDCPLIDPEIVQNCIDKFRHNRYDYLSNTYTKTYPRGLDCEVFTFKALKKAYENAETKFETEHVTTYIYSTHREDFKIGEVNCEEDLSRYRITLDEAADYEVIKEIYRILDNKTDFPFSTLVKILKENEYISEINRHIEQKKR